MAGTYTALPPCQSWWAPGLPPLASFRFPQPHGMMRDPTRPIALRTKEQFREKRP